MRTNLEQRVRPGASCRDLRLYHHGWCGWSIGGMNDLTRMDIERASPTDVMELVCDVSGTSMQVAAVLVLESRLPVEVAAVHAALADRVTCVPRLRQRLVDVPFGCGRPVWIDDPSFDIGHHLRSLGCPAPGDENALLGVVAEAIGRRLPPERPLWSATLVTGMTDNRSALVVVFHHVLADGIGGLAVLAHLVDRAPAAPVPAIPRFLPPRRELFVDVLRSGARAVGRVPAGIGRIRAAAAELGASRLSTPKLNTGSGERSAPGGDLSTGSGSPTTPGGNLNTGSGEPDADDGKSGTGGSRRAPRCSLNRPIGKQRAFAVARADLDAIHAAAHAQGGTVNDLIVTAVTGALRTVLAGRGEDVDRLVVSMPVSARQRASATELGNRVGVIPVAVPTTGEPTRRLAAVARITRRRKSVTPGSSAALIGPVFRGLAKVGVFGWFINRQRMVNTFVSNLRGPEHRMSFLGAAVVDLIPVPMITGNITVAFAALSYAGTLTITVVADPERCPDLPEVASALHRELQVLTGAVTPAPGAR